MRQYPSVSTDQVAALVALARSGSLRAAAGELVISEQGLRNRLLALERRLGEELYHKSRGPRSRAPLTSRGRQFLPHAVAFLEQAADLLRPFDDREAQREVHVVGSQYLIAYVLPDAVRRFHAAHPQIRVRLSARNERDIEETLRTSVEHEVGLAAPYEPAPDLEYRHLFSMDWSLVLPHGHRLVRAAEVTLGDIVREPLIVYESGSTGRQHVMEAFQRARLDPHVEMEATNTDLVIRMVEAGLGLSIVPLLENGAVTRGRRVKHRPLAGVVRPIDSGILLRRDEPLSAAARAFVTFVLESERLG